MTAFVTTVHAPVSQGRSRVQAVVSRVGCLGREHWPVLAVLGAFATSALVVPTLAPIATTDDWGYARSVEILVRDGDLRIFPVVAATAVFQIVWGALFALVFGLSLGVLRLSTLAMVALGGLAVYGVCRQLGVTRGRAAFGSAAYLFNPLGSILAFTFMTDPHFTALMMGSVCGYARGLDPDAAGRRATLVGSALAAMAFLTRQQGVLIPLAVGTFLLLTGRLRPNKTSVAALLRVGAVPALTMLGYYLWLRLVNDVPDIQRSFLREATNAGWDGTWRLVRHVGFFALVYVGLFVLPIVLAALPAARRLVRGVPPGGWIIVCAWEAAVVGGVAAFAATGRWLPYIPQFLGPGGPGAADVKSARPTLLELDFRRWATILCAAASVALALILARRVQAAATPARAKAGLVLAIGGWQIVGLLPPSYHYLSWSGSLDRYLLPLLPISVCLALWALADVRIALPVGWIAVAVYAVVSTAGARDYLVFMDNVWDIAREANDAGVPNDKLDAGSGWDGYHLYERSLTDPVRSRTPNGPWWIGFYAPHTDSTYLVAGRPQPGYVIVRRHPYSLWLERQQTYLYLLRRRDAPWPPDCVKVSPATEAPRGTNLSFRRGAIRTWATSTQQTCS